AEQLEPEYPPPRRAGSRRRRANSRRCACRARGRIQGGRGGRRAPAQTAAEARAADVSERITQQQLESYLWGAATLLRGLIDAGDYKQFIFPLLFFKRMSDVWDEEYA